jgi:hypothetical protein
LEEVFRHWIERLEWVFQNNGDHYPSAKYWLIDFSWIPLREGDAALGWNTLYESKGAMLQSVDWLTHFAQLQIAMTDMPYQALATSEGRPICIGSVCAHSNYGVSHGLVSIVAHHYK